jgi:hypothetical protein
VKLLLNPGLGQVRGIPVGSKKYCWTLMFSADWPIGQSKGQQIMEFAPIAGIRAVSLLNLQKPVDRVAPRFEIEASERSGDEHYSPSQQQAPERGLEDEEEDAETLELAATDSDAGQPESASDGRLDWFV